MNRNKRAVFPHRRMKSNQLQAAQVTAHASPTTCCFTCLPKHYREVSHPRDILPYCPPQAAAHPILHGKAAGYYVTLVFQYNPTLRVFSASPKHQVRHIFLGFVCPYQLQETATYSQQKVTKSACLPRKLFPATCTKT